MPIENDEATFNSSFVQRVKDARAASGLTQAQAADSLGIPLERYKKYEQRTQLPHYLAERFCDLTGIDIHYLMTGKFQKPHTPVGPAFERRRR